MCETLTGFSGVPVRQYPECAEYRDSGLRCGIPLGFRLLGGDLAASEDTPSGFIKVGALPPA